jgi:hypothetical protein
LLALGWEKVARVQLRRRPVEREVG